MNALSLLGNFTMCTMILIIRKLNFPVGVTLD
jgi:hypothetical protein